MEIEKKEGENQVVPPVNEETPEQLKEKLQKAEEERDNYKQGLLNRETELKALKSKEKETEEENEEKNEEETQWDDASKKFQEETLVKSQKFAEEAATKVLEKKNDSTAQTEFRESHPEITDEKWVDIVANYNPKNGKDSIKSVVKDLERAYVIYRFDKGETIDPAEESKRQAQEKNKELNIIHGTAGSGRYEADKDGATEGQKSIASRAGISVDALNKEDDTLRAEVTIV